MQVITNVLRGNPKQLLRIISCLWLAASINRRKAKEYPLRFFAFVREGISIKINGLYVLNFNISFFPHLSSDTIIQTLAKL